MSDTTLIRKRGEMQSGAIDGCHDGVGEIMCTSVMGGAEGRSLNFMHDDILPPETSIGVHTHEGDEEYYYILTGTGVMTLDGARHDVVGIHDGGLPGQENQPHACIALPFEHRSQGGLSRLVIQRDVIADGNARPQALDSLL